MADSYLEDLLAQASLGLLKLRLVKRINVPNPAAGANVILPVPGGCIWELLHTRLRFVASAVVATRNVALQIQDSDNNVLGDFPQGSTTAASVSLLANWYAGYGAQIGSFNSVAMLPNPPHILLPGDTLRTQVSALDAGDQLSQVFVTVREWDETAIMQEAAEMDQNFADYISQRTYTRENG